MDWKDTDMWRFTKEHQTWDVESCGAYIGKEDGYTPLGYVVESENKLFYFGLDGHFIKVKVK